MIDPVTGGPHTYHTTNPVPFVLVTDDDHVTLQPNGSLRDIAPTMLGVLGQPQPQDMTGRDLRVIKTVGVRQEVPHVFQNVGRPQRPEPQKLAFGNLPVPGTKAGAIVSIGLVVIAWIAIPVAHPSSWARSASAPHVGLFLTWLHRREGLTQPHHN